jgi:hypothetical protein
MSLKANSRELQKTLDTISAKDGFLAGKELLEAIFGFLIQRRLM